MKVRAGLIAAMILSHLNVAFASNVKTERTLTVQGQGKASAIPDIARLTVEVSNDGAELDPILSQVRKDMNRVMEGIKKEGIAEKDIQTSLFQVQPKYEHDKRGNAQRIGFIATNRVTVKIRDMKKIGKVLSNVLSSGATSVNGPDLELDNPAMVEREALAAATQDAILKAKTVAEAARVELGEIISINPQSVNWPMPRHYAARGMMMAEGGGDQPIAAGEQTLTASASITFAIQ